MPIDDDRIIIAVPSFINPPSNFMSPRQLDEITIDQDTTAIALGGYMEYTGKYNSFLEAILQKVESISPDPRQRPIIILTAAAQDVAASEDLRDALKRASQMTRVMVFANAGEFRRLMDMDTNWRIPHESKWWLNGKKLEGNELEEAKWADADYIRDKLNANAAAYEIAYERYAKDQYLPATFVVTNGKRGVRVIDGEGVSDNYTVPKPPHGVKNTVGAGDGFAAGYIEGFLLNFAQQSCIDLGFVCAGEIIGQDKARLEYKEIVRDMDGAQAVLTGLPAYLDPLKPTHKKLLLKFLSVAQSSESVPVRPFKGVESITSTCGHGSG